MYIDKNIDCVCGDYMFVNCFVCLVGFLMIENILVDYGDKKIIFEKFDFYWYMYYYI